MAQVASDRIDQMQDPELSIEQAMQDYKRLGYSDNWINQRIRSIEVRKELTDEWQRGGVSGMQYASLTDIITKEWSGRTTKQYKQLKGLKKENLRDNMTNVPSTPWPRRLPQKSPNSKTPRASNSTPPWPRAEAVWPKPHATNWKRSWAAPSYPPQRLKTTCCRPTTSPVNLTLT